jgi:two-component system, response regulator RegA
MKILIVEDDADQLSLRCMLLSRSGFETIGAADEDSAIESAKAHKPECAVVDLRLPTEELGLRLIRNLKALNPAMHVLVLTGRDARHLSNLRESPMISAIVTKGSSTAALIERLNAFAARPRDARS